MKKIVVLVFSLFLFLNVSSWAQTSTVVIAEVMYDHPVLDAVKPSTILSGEFLSLYNYGEDDVDISGWRVDIVNLLSPFLQSTYTLPAHTLLPSFSLAVITSRSLNSTFDIGRYYGSENLDSMGNIVLYSQNLVFPDIRSRIRIYDAQNQLQDELVYDGMSDFLPNEPLLRAENAFNPNRPIEESVSIQRQNITVVGDRHIISRTDYYPHTPSRTVQLFSYLPEGYSYAYDPSSDPILAPTPTHLSLTGTITGNHVYKASYIESSQVIESGKVTYLAEEEIIFGPGFEVKLGAEFETIMERDSFHQVTMLTYNLWGTHTDYKKHAEVIKASNAGVVAVQEVKRIINFRKLRDDRI